MSYEHVRNSVIGTTIAEIATLPICTLKTNYQNTNSNSITATAKSMYKTNGIKSFYVASVPAILSQVFSTSTKYTLYKFLENKNYQYTNKITNGIFSGIVSSLMTHPIDSIKIHTQMRTPFLPELRKHGMYLFYRGYSKTFSKVVVGSALFFPLYDTYRNIFNGNALLASVASGFTSTLIMHPIDYLKTRHIYGQKLYAGWNPIIYYKGLTLNLLRIVPHFTIVMISIDYLEKKWDNK